MMCWACSRGIIIPRRWVTRRVQRATIESHWFDAAGETWMYPVLSFLFFFELTPREEMEWENAETYEQKDLLFRQFRMRRTW